MSETEMINGAVRHGGFWTLDKLQLLENYLNSYTTALKNQPFYLMYIDAFAGSGKVWLRDESIHAGSVLRALKVTDKDFDQLVFIDINQEYSAKLKELKQTHSDRDIIVYQGDANQYLQKLRRNLQSDVRGVLFLDPFGTQVDFDTMRAVSRCQALDTWLMFSLEGVQRMLRRKGLPLVQWHPRLTRIFGTDEWQSIYEDMKIVQPDFEGQPEYTEERPKNVDGFLELYKSQLRCEFGDRLLDDSYRFVNSKNAPLFELIFCAGNPAGTETAHRIARHLIENLRRTGAESDAEAPPLLRLMGTD